MNNLPEQSTASTVNGIWFVFPEPHTIVRVWLSTMSGKEKVFANDDLIFETRNVTRLKTFYEIIHADCTYGLEIITRSMLSMQIECNLFKDGQLIGSQLCEMDVMGAMSVRELDDRATPLLRALSWYRSRAFGHLQEYDLAKAKKQYEWVLKAHPSDAESHFYLACIASLEEDTDRAIAHLETALAHQLSGRDRILSVDYLAFIRIRPEFVALREKYGL